LTVNGTHVIRKRGNIPTDEIRKQEGEILYWGGFSARGKLYTEFEDRGKLYAGVLSPPWGKFYPGPVFPGGKFMLRESLCYNTPGGLKA
jgi:hypothetical protein